VRDAAGVEWLTYTEAAHAFTPPLRVSTIRSWAHRGYVEKRGVGRRAFVHMGDVRRMEAAMRHAAQVDA
jgi:hypothetical protein